MEIHAATLRKFLPAHHLRSAKTTRQELPFAAILAG
jgi:hypothetical protein